MVTPTDPAVALFVWTFLTATGLGVGAWALFHLVRIVRTFVRFILEDIAR